MRRLAPSLMFLACAGGLVYSTMSFRPPAPPPVKSRPAPAPAPARQLQGVRGQVTPDKIALMSDPEMARLFASNGLSVQVGVTPGRDMIDPPTPESQYVFSWPTDDETASMIAERLPRNPWIRNAPAPFYTSPVILAWAPAADALAKAGMVNGSGRWRTVDMRSLVSAASGAKSWSDVSPKAAWTSDRPLQVRMPDLDRSGTSTMFLALAAQSANGGRDVVTPDQALQIADRVAPMFKQGRQPATAREAVTEFVSFGISRTPLLLVSEADAIQLVSRPDASRDIVILYPDETVVSPQAFMPYTLMGQRVGRILDRPEARRIALRHGFRVAGVSQAPGRWASADDAPPSSFQTILEMPEPRIVETMIDRIMGRGPDTPTKGEDRDASEDEAETDAPVSRKEPVAPVIRDPGEELPPRRPIVDPNANAESQQAKVRDYIMRLKAYQARQAARAAVAGERQ